jgi:hypothetical protein
MWGHSIDNILNTWGINAYEYSLPLRDPSANYQDYFNNSFNAEGF